MEPADQPRPEPHSAGTSKRGWNVASLGLVIGLAVLLVAIRLADLQSPRVELALWVSLIGAVVAFALLSVGVIRKLRGTERQAKTVFEDREREFHQMADNIQEIFWVIDAQTKKATYVNPAYQIITGRSCQSLLENPSSYEEVIHPDDRVSVLSRLAAAARSGSFDERFRIVKPDGEVRWIWVRGFPRRDADGKITRLGGTALDITALKKAEDQVAANLAKANSAREEAEALRKATLALTEDLHMDCVLDALLHYLAELVPYTCARVLVPEGGPHWLALGEKSSPEPAKKSPRSALTFVADESPFFQRIWSERKRVLVPDTRNEKEWETFEGHKQFRSWLCVPLVASEELLGFLSVGHSEPNHFTEDHLRRAELLAIPAAAAIQNARLYSTAEIYGSELEKRLADLQKAEQALDQSEADRRVSEEKFQNIFHSGPVAFSITTLEDGRFLEVNAAFENRYGYRREELLGRTANELRIWEEPGDRRLLLTQLRRGGPIRNVITRLRTKSGEVKLTVYSADRIQFDGQTCILAVSEDVVTHDPTRSH
ncbi:MAG TPA: PAS domain S-box protein [Candidatus Sulfotelmatobacter sp.]|nr:PAS domain S-box protein [Candidatus Sulfotelmatobacter sp.]